MSKQPTVNKLTDLVGEALGLGVIEAVPNDVKTKTMIEKYLLPQVVCVSQEYPLKITSKQKTLSQKFVMMLVLCVQARLCLQVV